MKTVPGALATHLAGELTSVTSLWLIVRRDGMQLAFTEHDQPLTVGGITYQPGASYEATAIRTGSAMKLDTLEARGIFDSDAISDADLQAHLYDQAVVTVSLVNWQAPGAGAVILHRGTIGTVKRGQNGYQAELRGITRGLQNVIGETYQPGCRADLGDARCKVDLSTLQQTGAVIASTDNWSFQASGLSGAGPRTISYSANTIFFSHPNHIYDPANLFTTPPHVFMLGDAVTISGTAYNNTTHGLAAVFSGRLDTVTNVTDELQGKMVMLTVQQPGYFDFGLVTWTSGQNSGVTSDVRAWDGTNQINLLLPTPFPIAGGDAFTITPGCDKRIETCVQKFNNVLNFRGEPFVPGQDAALAYPNAG